MASKATVPTRREVVADDLKRLDIVREILSLLNDPRQSAKPIADLVGRFPVLEARLRHAFRPSPLLPPDGTDAPTISKVLSMLGNRNFEAVLLELLEDLTILRSTIDG